MDEVDRIIYAGNVFTVEWYVTARGRSSALEYFGTLSDRQQDRFLALIRTIGDIGKIFNTTKFNYEGNEIYAFKPQPDRFLCFFYTGRKIIVTNGFRKKTQKLPASEKNKALLAKQDYKKRIEEESYYE